MQYLMLCAHKTTKLKLVSWATWDGVQGHQQGFKRVECCATCGCVVNKEDKVDDLQFHINDHVACGSVDMSQSLGIQKMPEGYALMLNPDHTYYYWLRYNGIDSCNYWNKWDAYYAAKHHNK